MKQKVFCEKYGFGYVDFIFTTYKYVLDFRYNKAKDKKNLMMVKFEKEELLIMCSYYPLETVHKKHYNTKFQLLD